jgi:hypothetical protein
MDRSLLFFRDITPGKPIVFAKNDETVEEF